MESKKTKTKELETISKDLASEFKYTDHIVNNPLSIGDFTIGKNTIAGSNLRRIDSITACSWNDFKKRENKIKWQPKIKYGTSGKLKKINPEFIPNTISYTDTVFTSNGISYIPNEEAQEISRPYRHHPLDWIKQQKLYLEGTIHDRINTIETYKISLNPLLSTQQILLQNDENTLENINYELSIREAVEEALHIVDVDFTNDSVIESLKTFKKIEEKVEQEKELSYLEKLKKSLSLFKYNYGQNPAIVKGYIINDSIVDNNKDLESLLRSGVYIAWEEIKTILRVFEIEEDKIINKIKLVKGYKFIDLNRLDIILPILPLLVKFKIISSKNSNNFFTSSSDNKIRNSLRELNLQNLNWKIESISITRNKVKHSTYIAIVEYPESEDSIKFTLSDCRFVNQSICGYNIPLDKTIKLESIVRVKENKIDKYSIKINNNAEVINIRTNPSSKKISKECNNRRMDIITIILANKKLNVYAQDLKFIENKKQQNVNANIKKEESKKTDFNTAWKSQLEDYIYTSTKATYFNTNDYQNYILSTSNTKQTS